MTGKKRSAKTRSTAADRRAEIALLRIQTAAIARIQQVLEHEHRLRYPEKLRLPDHAGVNELVRDFLASGLDDLVMNPLSSDND